ncbi:hypothetical protein SAMN05414139_10680 [Burkholderia sp. D7]|nr:hypothetical protein SAMN05414139_10680 [Burkholderia sp. D7]
MVLRLLVPTPACRKFSMDGDRILVVTGVTTCFLFFALQLRTSLVSLEADEIQSGGIGCCGSRAVNRSLANFKLRMSIA